MLSTMGLHILSILQGVPRSPRNLRRHIDERIQPAQLLITRRYHETIIIEQLARELHIGYSSFRQAFKAQTGLSPKQYQLQIRLQKAQEFLANTSKSVGEIAEILGFNTAYHLSNQFKKHVGLILKVSSKMEATSDKTADKPGARKSDSLTLSVLKMKSSQRKNKDRKHDTIDTKQLPSPRLEPPR
jgi:AraC-like DNA-binding protein